MAAESDIEILKAFGLCVVAFLVIVSLHLVGLHGAARLFRGKRRAQDIGKRGFGYTVIFIVCVMSLLFTLHLLTNLCWGVFIWGAGVLPGYRESVFYSLENYTALGLTRVNVSNTWRMLAPMISLSGVFCLGWSTAMLVGLFGHLYAMTDD